MTVPEDAKCPEPPWKEIVTEAWRIITDWETDYKKHAGKRCIKKMHALLVGKWEEPWRQWDKSQRKDTHETSDAANHR